MYTYVCSHYRNILPFYIILLLNLVCRAPFLNFLIFLVQNVFKLRYNTFLNWFYIENKVPKSNTLYQESIFVIIT